MNISNMGFKDFEEWFTKLDLECIKDFQRVLTKVENMKIYGRPKSMLPRKGKKMNTLDCMPCAAVPCAPNIPTPKAGFASMEIYVDAVCVQEKKETTMYKDERTEAQQAKDYLIKSLEKAIWEKEIPLMEAFGLRVKIPQTIGELKQAVADGWLRVDTGDRKDDQKIYSWLDYAVFNDPKVKKDEEGFHKAWKQVTVEASDVKDAIVVLGPEKGLEALNAFKAKTLH